MRPLRRQLLLSSFKGFDLAVILGSLAVVFYYSSWNRMHSSWAEFLGSQIELRLFLLFISFGLTWVVIGHVCGLYRSRRLADREVEIAEVLKATFASTLVLWPLGTLLQTGAVSLPVTLRYFLLASLLLVVSRFGLRYFLKELRLRGRNLRHLLIVGSNQRAVRFLETVEATPEWGYHAVGFVDDQVVSSVLEDRGCARICGVDGLADFLRGHVVDEVAVFLPWKSSYEKIAAITTMCQQQGITIRLSSEVVDLPVRLPEPTRMASGSSILIGQGFLWKGTQLFLKRSLDIILSLLLLILSTPLLLLVMIVVKFSSPGGIFFAQERVGVHKRRFKMYKFRTMVVDAESRIGDLEDLNEVDGPVFKIKGDPRITPIGKWLRKTSLDELPQLLNVLKGDMSLVGPRPLPVRDYERFYEDGHRRRLSIRPGLTCLWQVGGRSNVAFEQWMELDMKYIDEWSLRLDFRILLATIPAVLRGSGAE